MAEWGDDAGKELRPDPIRDDVHVHHCTCEAHEFWICHMNPCYLKGEASCPACLLAKPRGIATGTGAVL